MPYDPDSEDEVTQLYLGRPRQASVDLSKDHPKVVDDMDVDSGRRTSGWTHINRDSDGRPPLKAAKVAVVLQSSPQKNDYSPVPNDFMDTDNGGPLITSDLLPQHQPKSPFNPLIPKVHSQLKSEASVSPGLPPFPISQIEPTITPQPRKRGRPFGWKPGMPYSTHPRRLGPGRPSGKPSGSGRSPGRPPGKTPKVPKTPGEAKRRGRPPKKDPISVREIYLNSAPKFPHFFCEWEGCSADLQNLETLRKHLVVVHGQAGTCRWGSCPGKHPEPLHFASPKDFETHIDKTHVLSCSWHLGDGPRNEPLCPPPKTGPAALPAYLFDSNGKQVTPAALNLDIEDDEARKNRRAKLARLLLQRDDNAPSEPSYTAEDWEEINLALNAKRKKQKMFRDYHAAACGSEGYPPRYGPEWKGLLVKGGHAGE